MTKTQIFNNIRTWAALLIAGAAFAACSGDDDSLTPTPSPNGEGNGQQVYTMTVQASKGGEGTRALTLTGSTLSATWAQGEEVTVYNETKKAALGGKLVAQSSGASTTLKGTLTGTIENGDNLTLKFLSPTYGTQDGTLTGNPTSIDKVCDYAEATVTVSAVSGSSITTSDASFENKQAIVKFTLKKASGSSISAYEFCVSDGTNEYWASVGDGGPINEVFMAIPAISAGNVTLKANAYPYGYKYEKSGVTFAAGNYYEITVKMAYYLDWTGGEITLQDGDKLTGSGNSKVSIADGATVTLVNASINGSSGYSLKYAGITCLGDASIMLEGANTVKGFNDGSAGIYVPSGKTLTIQGSGSLDASAERYAAGIGSGGDQTCGNIRIIGGIITATGGQAAAGIGGGYRGNCGTITITDGVTSVTATKGSGADNSIGCNATSTCGTVTIGGTVYYNGSTYQNGGDTYLNTNPLVYEPYPIGAIRGEFSVSSTKKVYFSKGNLEYTKSTGVWSFMEHQYSTVETNASPYCTDDYGDKDVVSLFGWGTSGYDHGATCYQPYCTTRNNPSYYAFGDSQKDLTGQADWGYNAISNGGNTVNSGWRTLTQPEWTYLFSNHANGWSSVAGVAGYVIRPDGVSTAIASSYTASAWAAEEAAGSVFLPAAGYRDGTSVYQVDSQGYYWSSYYVSDASAGCVYFSSSSCSSTSRNNRYTGLSVRLVRDAN